MSTDQGERAGWSPDQGEFRPVDSQESETALTPTRLSRPSGDPRDQAIEWMRSMGFTDAETAAVGVSLFLVDGQAGQRSAGNPGTDLIRHAGIRAEVQTVLPATLDEPLPSEPVAFIYPTVVSDDRAVAAVRKETQGHLSNREALAWVRHSWVPVYRLRTDFTSKSGLRNELRFASTFQLFESISGHPIAVKLPKSPPSLELAGPTAVPVHPRVPVDDVIDETIRIWNEYCGLKDKESLKRYADVLTARGVPASVAHTINVELDAQILFPVFVGLLTHSTGHRLVAFDGVSGKFQAALSSAMTLNLRSVREDLGRNRSVRRRPA